MVRYTRTDEFELDTERHANNIINVSGSHFAFDCARQSLESALLTFVPSISSNNQNRTAALGDGCKILNWNYTEMSAMGFNDAMNYSSAHHRPDAISCKQQHNNYFHYEQEPNISIVPEVSNWKSASQDYVVYWSPKFPSNGILWRSGISFVRIAFGVRPSRSPFRSVNSSAQRRSGSYRTNTVEKNVLSLAHCFILLEVY